MRIPVPSIPRSAMLTSRFNQGTLEPWASAVIMPSIAFLPHMDFRIGSGLAGIHDGGNVAQDVHFYGGRYGIWTRKPSPGWHFTVIDATFEGQREAAIREHEAGLTLIRSQFKDAPTAISIDPQYSDELRSE